MEIKRNYLRNIYDKVEEDDIVRNGIPPEDAEKASKAWGEDNEELTKLLENCIKRGIPTLACCAGHIEEENPDPYIVFQANNQVALELATLISDDESCEELFFWLTPWGIPGISIHAEMEKRNDFFKKLNNYLIDNDRKDKIEDKEKFEIFANIVKKSKAGNKFYYTSKTREYSIGRLSENYERKTCNNIQETLAEIPDRVPEQISKYIENYKKEEEQARAKYLKQLKKENSNYVKKMIGKFSVSFSSILDIKNRFNNLIKDKEEKEEDKTK